MAAGRALRTMPAWTWLIPALALALLALEHAQFVQEATPLAVLCATLLIGGVVFAAVHHAEVVALRIGEPMGSLVLAAAVTAIETSLILSVLLSSESDAPEIARDTVIAAMMIVLNGVVGLCLLVGGLRHHEQGFQVQGATGALSVLGTLATLAMILPNYTLAIPGPVYAPVQLAFVAVMSLALYGLFVFVQTVSHRAYFLDAEVKEAIHTAPGARAAWRSAGLLVVSLASVVLLAESLTPSLQGAVSAAGLPQACVGVVIAALTLMPEGLSAFRAARANRLQTSLNLALGSALASIGLTIPLVSLVSVSIGKSLTMGLQSEDIVLLILTLFTSTLTLATGRTTVLQGGVHMVIFAAFLIMTAVP
ncbi:MAG: calcium:proton antiporter [Rhodobacteraceae bacterium]|nr:calcium:proton antiporter [Paracoccaceae bacterium]